MTSPQLNYRAFEIIAAVLTGAGKFVFMDWLNWKLAFIICVCLFWLTYGLFRYRKEPQVLETWGLSGKGFRHTFLELLPFAAVIVLAFILLGNHLGTSLLNWRILPVLLLYPIWGVIQQFLTVGLIAGNLDRLERFRLPRAVIILLTALIFGLIHYPRYLLIAATFLLALVYTFLYLRQRNLLVLGIFHGWLGAFFFYTIMGEDSWLLIFGTG